MKQCLHGPKTALLFIALYFTRVRCATTEEKEKEETERIDPNGCSIIFLDAMVNWRTPTATLIADVTETEQCANRCVEDVHCRGYELEKSAYMKKVGCWFAYEALTDWLPDKSFTYIPVSRRNCPEGNKFDSFLII